MAVGLTLTVAPLLMPLALKLVVPSVYTTLNVPGVGNVNVNSVLPPEQIVEVPLMLAVGKGLMTRFTVLVINTGVQKPLLAFTEMLLPVANCDAGKVMTSPVPVPGNVIGVGREATFFRIS